MIKAAAEKIAGIVLVLLTSDAAAFAQARNYDTYRCDRPGTPDCPVINASIADPAWSGASPFIPPDGDYRSYPDAGPPDKISQTATTYDADRIYMVLIASDLESNPNCGNNVWMGDGAEAFFDIDAGGPDYTDYWEVNVSTVCESSQWSAEPSDKHWDWAPAMALGGAVGAGIEYSIPFASFQYAGSSDPVPASPPPDGSVWGFCPCRSEGNDGYSSWCHIVGSFHDPYQWGTLTFRGAVAADSPASWGQVKAGFR